MIDKMYDIYFNLSDMHQVVRDEEVTGEGEFWVIGETFEFDFITEDPSIQQNDDYAVVVRRNHTCICTQCGEIFPYAEPNQQDGSFKCWSCRHW